MITGGKLLLLMEVPLQMKYRSRLQNTPPAHPSKKRQAYSAQDFQKGMAFDWVHRGNAGRSPVAVGELARGGGVGVCTAIPPVRKTRCNRQPNDHSPAQEIGSRSPHLRFLLWPPCRTVPSSGPQGRVMAPLLITSQWDEWAALRDSPVKV